MIRNRHRWCGSELISAAVWAAFVVLLVASAPALSGGLERLVMPGRVIAGHADVEAECNECHDADSDQAVALLCTACHEDIGNDRLGKTGFHGRFPASRKNECIVCHTDHEGRKADIVQIDSGIFDHSFTDFVLKGAHIEANCSDCHNPKEAYRDAPSGCGSCHADIDVHEGALGSECSSCHSQSDWKETTFDHSTTDYPLTGAHVDVVCADCHRDNQFDNTSRSCANCHAIDDVHEGNNGNACYECHSTSRWRRIGFDHFAETGFALTDGHGGLICSDCHQREDFKDNFDRGCVDCHASDDFHQDRNGTDCGDCHQADEWAQNTFDHDETGFALVEAHADLNCTACHKEDVTVSLPTNCGDCHAMDDAHAGQLGNDCKTCHAQHDWHSSILFDHDLSSFPLTGLHATAACGACHQDLQFANAETECLACHIDDDVHEGVLGINCGGCHTSNGWLTTVFDHDTNTSFPLDGGHVDLSCAACHSDSGGGAGDVPSTCGGCHTSDDVHDGQFGMQCAECHTTSTFSAVEKL